MPRVLWRQGVSIVVLYLPWTSQMPGNVLPTYDLSLRKSDIYLTIAQNVPHSKPAQCLSTC